MSENITDYKPELVWKYFQEISRIPRCSKHEKAVGDYIESVAKRLGLDYTRDSIGNIVIRKPASPGYEKSTPVVLQGHMDMVCEKDSDVEHDFSKDPIELVVEGDWLTAKGTTLGADNGVGVSAGLAVLEDDSIVHGPLEVLITVDEETGMTGAFALSEDALKGKIFINLDSEEEGTVYIGCAGGGDTRFSLPIERIRPPADTTALKVKVSGLRGGHSGVDINEGRANAIKVLARVLREGSRTIIKNFSQIAKAVNRSEEHLYKYLVKSLGTAGFLESGRLTLQGKFTEDEVQKEIESYVKDYVLCKECGAPDTTLVREERILFLKCMACGAKHPVRPF